MPRARSSREVVEVLGLGQNTIDHLCVVDTLPTPDSKHRLVRYAVQPGGQVATALVALARWGTRAGYVGVFGDDQAGAQAREALLAEGVDVSHARVRHGLPNQVSVILVEQQSGERTVLWDRSPGLTLAPEEVPAEAIGAARLLFLDGADGAAARRAAEAARAAGVPTLADLDGSCEEPAALVPLIDVLLVSQEFARRYTGTTSAEAALAALVRAGGEIVGVTLGRAGVLVSGAGRELHVPAYPIAAVDTTGAGDLFHAGFAWGLLAGLTLEETVRLATAAAALQCTRLGGRDAIPGLGAVRALAGL